MPPKREKKDEGKEKTDVKDERKKKKLAKGAGMGGTIGLIEKPIRKCLTVKKTACPPPCCPPPVCPSPPQCCPPVICTQQICYVPTSPCCPRPC